MDESRQPVDLDRFLGALESAHTVPFSGDFLADGTWHSPYTGPGIRLLLGGDFPPGVAAGAFWEARVFPADRARYAKGMRRQQRGESSQMEYRIQGLDGRLRWIRECAKARKRQDGGVRIDGVVIDVTEQRTSAEALEGELAVTRGRLDSVLAALEEYLYVWRFPAAGPAVVDFESVPLATFIGHTPGEGEPVDAWLSAVHPDDREIFLRVLEQGAACISGDAEYRISGSDERVRWMLDRWQCRRDEEDGVVVEGIVSDITVRKQAQDGLAIALAGAQEAYAGLEAARLAAERAANTDPLTRLANRRSFQRSLEHAVDAAAEAPFGLILLDVDHFKRINDTYGHQTGDDVLVEIVARMQLSTPPGVLLARWGGEEFSVLVPGADDAEELRAVAESIREAVRGERLKTRRGLLAATISCGAVLSTGGSDIDELVHAADAAMYRAKRAGRDRTLLASDSSSEPVEDASELLLLAQAFAHTASVREGIADMHCAQVAELAGQIAVQLDLSSVTVLRCRLAGWLHDVGKVTIPECVLAKPGPLSEAEWRVMVTHAAFGGELVAGTPGIAESAAGVRHHHERWDGTGYPDQLAGHAIPLEARVVAAADAWNAMTHDRVYRQALDFESACAEVLGIAGSQLDPRVAEALLAIVRGEREQREPVAQAA
jgi:diguanylate cyclase (GGDEF)-like protein